MTEQPQQQPEQPTWEPGDDLPKPERGATSVKVAQAQPLPSENLANVAGISGAPAAPGGGDGSDGTSGGLGGGDSKDQGQQQGQNPLVVAPEGQQAEDSQNQG